MTRTLADRLDDLARATDRLLADAGPADLTKTYDYRLQQTAERVADSAAALAGGEYRPAYNGWVNRETWNTALWIGNDQGTDETAREIVAEAYARDPFAAFRAFTGHDPQTDAEGTRRARVRAAGDALSEWWQDTLADDGSDRDPAAGPVLDLVTYALACVDWAEIADHYAEDLPDDPDEDDQEPTE